MCLACDPRSERAAAKVSEMLGSLGASDNHAVKAVRGTGWAAAVVPPPVCEPSSGADIQVCGEDILIWTGDIFLPADWALLSRGESRARAIGKTLINRLRHRGVEALAELDGAFCGAWFDARRRQWTLFNDRIGMIPVFWSAGKEGLIAGPRAWAVWKASGEPLSINGLAVGSLLRTQNMVGEHTLIRSVAWLQPGHSLEWNEQGFKSRRYWSLNYDRPGVSDYDEAIDSYVGALRQTVQQSATCDSPLLLGISGGLDSRLFLAMCAELGQLPACFTVGFPFAEDVRFGRNLARVAGATHDWFPLAEERHSERLAGAVPDMDGLHSAAHFAPAMAVRDYLAAKGGGVLLEGFYHGMLGGAEVPGDAELDPALPPHKNAWASRLLHKGGSFELMNELLEPQLARDSLADWQEEIDRAWLQAATDDPLRRVEDAVIRNRIGRLETLGTAFLGCGALVRTPGAHRAMLEWFESVPPGMRRGKRLYMDVLRRRFPRFARVQRANYSALPITSDRWLREYHWQREKIYRLWAGCRYPVMRKWGADGRAIRAWMFEAWRAEGGLDMLREPNARVLEWVRRETLLDLWNQAAEDPLKGTPLMDLATIEIMVRWLESQTAGSSAQADSAVGFEDISACSADDTVSRRPAELVEVPA